ncbi:unnamed protein product [Sphagnum jensenii]|uniref:DUF4283 domain-containing protein n=1 Tax=Sphagnum jensenii TaxID=128206 RepID=A0ABP1BQA1_9BRYO
MASKLGEVLEIEAADFYIKRPAGPMITIELRDISKLPGYIRILSMAEGAETNDTVALRILYSRLPNQCRKCRRFGHHAWICTINRSKPWEGVPPSNAPLSTSGTNGKKSGGGASQPKQDQIEVPGSSEVDHVMTELASSPCLNHDRPNLVTRRHPKNAYTSKAKLNFGFREANSHQAPYLVANTNLLSSADDQEAQGTCQEEAGQTTCINMGSISSLAA